MSSFRLPIHLILPLVAAQALLTGACGVPVAVSAASYAADGGLVVASDKTSTDHLVSVVTKQDCAMWRVLRGRKICTERTDGTDPYKVEYNEPQRQVSEDGTQYTAPLRASADAPAASWDAATYKNTAPAPAPVTEGPMTATAEPEPAMSAPAAAAAPAPVKPKKAKTTARSAKKPSQGRAAPAS